MMKTQHSLLFHYSFTKRGEGVLIRGGALITLAGKRGTYSKGALIQGFTVYLPLNAKLNLHEVPRDLLQKLTFTLPRLGLFRYMYSR